MDNRFPNSHILIGYGLVSIQEWNSTHLSNNEDSRDSHGNTSQPMRTPETPLNIPIVLYPTKPKPN